MNALKSNFTEENIIDFYFHEINNFPFPEDQLREWILFLIRNEQKFPGSINIIFCSDQYLYDMNVSYLEHHYFTDVISFDYGNKKDRIISGDIFISFDRVTENSSDMKVPFLNELFRIVFHGVLHLAGYMDKSEEDKRVMTEKEDFYLAQCKL